MNPFHIVRHTSMLWLVSPVFEFEEEFFMIRSWIDHVTELEYHQRLQPARTAGVA